MFKDTSKAIDLNLAGGTGVSRKLVIAVILGVALIAFEIFNFDTTQYALTNLLGEIRFAGVLWASILAIAFCAIDFAGLVRLFTPQRGGEEPKAVWFLTGAWFLGTIANAVMTWWAVSLTLLSHEFGNEVLGREMLLKYVPIFVAMLVWLTRILFIGAFSVAGEDVLDLGRSPNEKKAEARAQPAAQPARAAQSPNAVPPKPVNQPAANRPAANRPAPRTAAQNQPVAPLPSAPAVTYEPVDDAIIGPAQAPKTNGPAPSRTSRIQQRPPMPGNGVGRAPGNLHASSSNKGH